MWWWGINNVCKHETLTQEAQTLLLRPLNIGKLPESVSRGIGTRRQVSSRARSAAHAAGDQRFDRRGRRGVQFFAIPCYTTGRWGASFSNLTVYLALFYLRSHRTTNLEHSEARDQKSTLQPARRLPTKMLRQSPSPAEFCTIFKNIRFLPSFDPRSVALPGGSLIYGHFHGPMFDQCGPNRSMWVHVGCTRI